MPTCAMLVAPQFEFHTHPGHLPATATKRTPTIGCHPLFVKEDVVLFPPLLSLTELDELMDQPTSHVTLCRFRPGPTDWSVPSTLAVHVPLSPPASVVAVAQVLYRTTRCEFKAWVLISPRATEERRLDALGCDAPNKCR